MLTIISSHYIINSLSRFRDMLWQELPESYPDESITYYRDAVYNFVSQRYSGIA